MLGSVAMSRKHNRTKHYKRSAGVKQPRKIICIRTEGKTERQYIEALIKKHGIKTTIDCKQAKGSDPVTVVRALVREKDNNLKDRAAAKIDSFWSVIDTEGAREKLPEAIELASKNKINMAISHPAFEYWLLLHFERSAKVYANEKELERDLRRLFPMYEKTLNNVDELIMLYETALENADILRQQYPEENPDLARTNFDELVREIVGKAD